MCPLCSMGGLHLRVKESRFGSVTSREAGGPGTEKSIKDEIVHKLNTLKLKPIVK